VELSGEEGLFRRYVQPFGSNTGSWWADVKSTDFLSDLVIDV